MPKFFCDYCDVYLTHDSMSVRKAHNSGRNHLRNVVDYYQQIGHEKAQSVIDSITSSYNDAGQSANNPMLHAQPGFGGPSAGFPPGFPPAPGGPMNMPPGMPPMPFGRGGLPPLPPGFPPPPGGFPPGMVPPNAPGGMPGFPGQAGSPAQGLPFAPPGGLPFPPPNMPPGFPTPPQFQNGVSPAQQRGPGGNLPPGGPPGGLMAQHR